MKIYSFPPISDKRAKVLILGTMPGERSLKLNQYYGHGGNTFWKLMFTIFEETFSNHYDKRKEMLIRYNIALWDVLQACEREGSSDSSILKEEPNNFKLFFENHPEIKIIAFNGQNAESYFLKYSNHIPEIKFISLPSTSPSNTWKTFDEKLSEWKTIKSI